MDLNKVGFDFLGFQFHKVRSRLSGKTAPLNWPSQKAMKSVRAKIYDLTDVRWLTIPPEQVVRTLAPVIRGWCGYFRRGNGSKQLRQLDRYVLKRLWKNYWRRGNRRSRAVGEKFVAWRKTMKIERFYLKGYCGGTSRKLLGEGGRKAV